MIKEIVFLLFEILLNMCIVFGVLVAFIVFMWTVGKTAEWLLRLLGLM